MQYNQEILEDLGHTEFWRCVNQLYADLSNATIVANKLNRLCPIGLSDHKYTALNGCLNLFSTLTASVAVLAIRENEDLKKDNE